MILQTRGTPLRCPQCQGELEALDYLPGREPELRCISNGHHFPVVRGVPRFVESDQYSESFGFQWNKFSRVQLDSYNGTDYSEQRFRDITAWSAGDLRGKRVLDAGCGAGRFAEIVARKYGAELYAVDLSSAVDACQANLAGTNALVSQASIYELPFDKASFDFVYCIGVIQHTPDPLKTIRALCKMVRPGGQIGLWIYALSWKSLIGTSGFKYLLRPIVKRLPREQQIGFCKGLVDAFYPLLFGAKHAGLPGKLVMRLSPVASSYLQSIELSPEDFRSWMFLDTFDMYTPAFDQPQRFETVTRVLIEEGFDAIQRHPHDGVAVTATRVRGR
jgi:2-polyprenyl-3-methyl-5-hydroxy-6-metoxy-1,4-benzoquinol methylase